ncbi:Methyltransferase-like protein 10 [Borealophlyctis nickersoniae]|nr:Methyltransferase-like protein 10 [Borealophlyctis nickersoniae]
MSQSTQETQDPSAFGSSVLGTKEYWDNAYTREVQNFDDHGDIGEIWFGEDSVEKMVDWTVDNYPSKSSSIIDLGCGNGHLLLELASLGYTTLTGIDYSPAAITLASKIANEHSRDISYLTYDLLSPPTSSIGPFDLALDKGTFDAISLAEPDASGKRPRYLYAESVVKLIKDDGVLLITSCNWVESELVEMLKSHFKFHDRVKYPTFTFGGVKGQTITTIAFKKL